MKKQTQVESQLQNILDRLSGVVAQIETSSLKSAALITGGDSYCYVRLFNLDAKTNRGIFGVQHAGDNPLYDVTIRVTDIDELQRLAEGVSSIALNTGTKVVDLGTVYAGRLSALRGWDLGGGLSPRRYNIEIQARNGSWSQQMRAVRLPDRWVTATRVSRDGKVLLEEAFEEFPRDESGAPVWD